MLVDSLAFEYTIRVSIESSLDANFENMLFLYLECKQVQSFETNLFLGPQAETYGKWGKYRPFIFVDSLTFGYTIRVSFESSLDADSENMLLLYL